MAPAIRAVLRRVVEQYYEIETNVSAGDVPWEADLVGLQRKATSHRLVASFDGRAAA